VPVEAPAPASESIFRAEIDVIPDPDESNTMILSAAMFEVLEEAISMDLQSSDERIIRYAGYTSSVITVHLKVTPEYSATLGTTCPRCSTPTSP
jgi:hypothetical protein